MNTHLVIILDCSGSMAEPFQYVGDEQSDISQEFSPDTSKISEAKKELLKIIFRNKSKDHIVTIIPFNEKVIKPIHTCSSKKDETQIREYLEHIQTGGSTALHLALKQALKIQDTDTDFVSKYYIITDGMADKPSSDIRIVKKLSSDQRAKFRGVLIDNDPDGAAHLREICAGDYSVTIGKTEFNKTMALEATRFSLEGKVSILRANMAQLNKNTRKSVIVSPLLQKTLNKLETQTQEHSKKLVVSLKTIEDKQAVDTELIDQQESSADECIDLQQELNQSLENIINEMKYLKISLSKPKLVSKRYSSPLIIQIHPFEKLDQMRKELFNRLKAINKNLGDYQTSTSDSSVEIGMTVIVTIECPGIQFTKPVKLLIENKVNTASFSVKPEDSCEVGKQIGKVSVTSEPSGIEITSLDCEFRIVDFVIDHISRPFIYKLVAALSGVGAFAMFMLTLFGQVDTTVGLASGTTVGAVCLAAYLQFTNLFQRLQTVSGTP